MININSRLGKHTLQGLLSTFVLFAVIAFLVAPGNAQKAANADKSRIAIKGYDTVAYFTEGRPVRGKPVPLRCFPLPERRKHGGHCREARLL